MRQKRRWLHALVMVLTLIGTLGLPARVFSNGLTRLLVYPAETVVSTCAAQEIVIRVEDVTNLTGYHLEIGFDPAVIEALAVVNGDFLSDPDELLLYEPTNEIDNVNGLIRFGLVQQNSSAAPLSPKTGSGELVVITVQAVTPNDATLLEIDADASMLVDWPDVQEIPFTATSGLVKTRNCSPTADPQAVTTFLNTPVNITLTGSDPDNDPLTYYLLGLPEHGALSGGLPNLTYTPDLDYAGSDEFSFVVYDGYETSALATVTIDIEVPKEGPEDILLSSTEIDEGLPSGSEVGVLSTVSTDTATYAYSLVSGVGDDDNASFHISGDQLLSSEVFDASVKQTYTIRVRSTDNDNNSLYVEKVFEIQILGEYKGNEYYIPLFVKGP